MPDTTTPLADTTTTPLADTTTTAPPVNLDPVRNPGFATEVTRRAFARQSALIPMEDQDET